jgi:hypothetical protein
LSFVQPNNQPEIPPKNPLGVNRIVNADLEDCHRERNDDFSNRRLSMSRTHQWEWRGWPPKLSAFLEQDDPIGMMWLTPEYIGSYRAQRHKKNKVKCLKQQQLHAFDSITMMMKTPVVNGNKWDKGKSTVRVYNCLDH